LQLLYGNVIAGFPTCAAREESARYVDHVRRASSLINERRSASGAKAPCRPGGLILKACDFCPALGHPKPPAPTANVSRVCGAVRTPGRTGMIVPGPSGGKVDLDLHCAAKTLACHRRCRCTSCLPCNRRLGHAGPHLREPCPRFLQPTRARPAIIARRHRDDARCRRNALRRLRYRVERSLVQDRVTLTPSVALSPGPAASIRDE
jgi:hypothetical protein